MQRDGKVAIVTGASSGIGQASAKALHQAVNRRRIGDPLSASKRDPF